MVFPDSHIFTGKMGSSALANDDVARNYSLPAVDFDTKPLTVAFATVL